jgi:pimeloyl-ACP methyl ester carboxylesterase
MVAITFSKPADKAMMAEICAHLTREEIMQIMTEATLCLRTEPDYHIPVPFLLLVADGDVTGNIRKIAPIWAAHDPNCKYVVIPNALHGAHLDNPEFFHAQLFGYLEQHTL